MRKQNTRETKRREAPTTGPPGTQGSNAGDGRLRRSGAAEARAHSPWVQELAGLLQSMPFFERVPRATLIRIAGQMRRRHLPKGATVFKQGDHAHEFCLLTSGRLEVTMQGGDPETPPVGVIEPPSWFGELAILTRQPRTATVTALTDSEMWTLPRDQFERVVARYPEMGRSLIATLCDRIQQKDRDFLGQSALAIERARLLGDLQKRNEELAALAEVTRAVSVSLDLDETLRTISTHATQLTRSDSASIFLYDETRDAFDVRASFNTPEEYILEGEGLRILGVSGATEEPLQSRPLFARAVAERKPIQVPDIQATTGYPSRDLLLRWGYQAVLVVPLLHADRVIGAMNVRRKRAGEFSAREVELVTTFARQSAVAIENARLFQDTQCQRVQLETLSENLEQLYRLSTAMQEPLSLKEQLARVLEAARQVVSIDRFLVWAVTPDGDRLVNLAWAGLSEEELMELQGVEIPLEDAGAMSKVYREGVSLVFNEENPVPADLRLKPPHSALRPLRTKSFLLLPMVARGRPVGILAADNKDSGRPILPQTVELLQTFASHAAAAVENARLFREIQETARQLEEVSRHKSQFLASMSHELRTPLNAIIGFSEVLLDSKLGPLSPDEQNEFVTHILTSGKHLLRLINDVLDLSKIEAGKMELQPEAVSLQDTIEGVLGTVKRLAAKKQVQVGSGLAPDLPLAWADPPRLKQVLYNLLSNAIKFTPAGGRVTVTARPLGLGSREAVAWPEPAHQPIGPPGTAQCAFIEIAVADTGIGIPAEDLGRIFEEFEQVTDPTRPRQEGTGLGLVLVKKLVEMHGGTVRVASTPGKGSTFTFTIPTAGP